MDILVYPTFEEIFPGEPVPVFEELIKKLPSSWSIQAYAFLNSKTHLKPFDLKNQEEIFKTWLGGMSKEKAKLSLNGYLRFKSKIEKTNPPGKIIILNPLSLLELIEQLLISNNQNMPSVEGEELEFLLLKVYLLKNQKNNLRNTPTRIDFSKMNEFIITQVASQYEFTHPKDILSQLIMAGDFFEFVSKNVEFIEHYNYFLEKKGINSYSQYLRQITFIYANSIKNREHNNFKVEGEDFVTSFFNSLSHELSFSIMGMKKMDEDFKILRDKPLLKVSDNIYCPLHLNFFIDKIYYGLIWDFYYSSSINKVFDKFQDYLQRLGTIVEKEIFYKHIDKCFPNRFIKKVNGSQYTSIEYSDYYIRDGKKIFVFEFKNSIVKSSIKYAHSFDDIEKEIKTKLYYDSNSRQDKGVKQLKKVILKIKHNKLDFDKYDGTLLGKLQIYPIIVYTDSFFSIDGISHLVNGLFRNEINSDAECFDLKIKDLILISMESLFDIISLIEKREYTFREICDIYFDKQKKQEKRGMKPTNENHIKKRFRGFDNTMAQILKTSKPSNEFIDLLIGALKN